MSTPAVTPQSDPFAEFGGASTGNANPQAKPSQPQPAPDPFKEFGGVSVDPETKANPQQTGEITNDVGQKVIVPKDGESFQDTMKRAVQYHQSLTPEQRKAAINAETATIPKKAAQTIAAAPAIGFGGTAALAVPNEITEALPSVLMHTTEGVKALGTWASAHPIQAYMLYQVVKDLIPGAKKAMGLVKSVPTIE
jgi:hypothetical protein